MDSWASGSLSNLPKVGSVRPSKTKKKGARKKTAKSKTQKSATVSASRKPTTKDSTQHVPTSTLRDAVINTMKSGEFMDGKEVVKKVQEQLGEIAPISIYAMLRTKGQFEKSEDGKYRVGNGALNV